jgi:hypothetical protein
MRRSRAAKPFSPGEELWLRGRRVTFVDYHGYAPSYPVGAAVVRKHDAETKSPVVVPLRKLARNRQDSLIRAMPLAPN